MQRAWAVTAIAFDVMDTLLKDPFREALTAATGWPIDELFAARDPALYPALECGDLDEAAYWSAHTRAGIDIDPDVFHEVRRSGTRWLPGMRDLVEDLDGLVVRATASNYPDWIDEVARDHLAGVIEHVVASCHLRVRKPDPAFFAGLLARLDRGADEVLFVDDRLSNVEAARACGLRAHRFTGAGEARRWIAEQGVAIPVAE